MTFVLRSYSGIPPCLPACEGFKSVPARMAGPSSQYCIVYLLGSPTHTTFRQWRIKGFESDLVRIWCWLPFTIIVLVFQGLYYVVRTTSRFGIVLSFVATARRGRDSFGLTDASTGAEQRKRQSGTQAIAISTTVRHVLYPSDRAVSGSWSKDQT